MRSRGCTPARRQAGAGRQGTILVVLVVLLLVTASIAGAVMRGMLLDARQLATDREAMQADRLAEAGLARGKARLTAEPDYAGEEWAAELADGDRGAVAITVTESAGGRTVEAAAVYPAEGERRVRARRSAVVPGSAVEGNGAE